MRDVIVVGCGGGGPVVAKELARWGLDVLVLESGPRYADPERQWSRLENDANNPITGYLRSGPGDRSKAAWPSGWRPGPQRKTREAQHRGAPCRVAPGSRLSRASARSAGTRAW